MNTSAHDANPLDVGKAVSGQSDRERIAHLRHELRTPLNAIQGFAELLLEESAGLNDSELTGVLHEMARTATSLVEMVAALADQVVRAGCTSTPELVQLFQKINAAVERIASLVAQLKTRAEFCQTFASDIEYISAANIKLTGMITSQQRAFKSDN